MKLRISNLIFLYFAIAFVGISGFFFTLFMPKPAGFYAFVLAASIGGFSVAANIFWTKRSGRQLVCPTGSNCNVVVNSRYSKFFGISLEYWGMVYFAVISASYLALILAPQFFVGVPLLILMLLTACAGLFSSYLLFVQAFLLRAWCIWCILSSLLSLTVFTISLISLQIAVDFLTNIENFINMMKFLGFSLGIGAASSAIFLFFRFLKDLSIDDVELEAIKGIFELVWVGFGLTMVSQFALYVVYAETMSQSGIFITQTIALFVAAFAGGIQMIIFTPFLVFVPFQKIGAENKSSFASLRRPTVALGAIVLSSWYFAFVMNFIEEASLLVLLSSYAGVLIIAIAASLIWERELIEKTPKTEQQ